MLELGETIAVQKLPEGAIQKLRHYSITTIREFVDTKARKLNDIINLPEDEIINIKRTLIRTYGPKRESLSSLYSQQLNNWAAYETGIEELDKILDGDGFAAGSVWEICGISGIGKTQVCHTIAVNFTTKFNNSEVLYIDTKCDFSGTRIRQILRSRNVNNAECGRLMHQIKVERVFSAEGVIHILEEILQQREVGINLGASAVKVVIIDALPAVWFSFRTEFDRRKGMYLLAKMANKMHKLAVQHYVAFVLVNLLVNAEMGFIKNDLQNYGEETTNAEEFEDFDKPQQHCPSKVPQMRPALGRYWSGVPRIRLSVEAAEQTSRDASLRIVKVLKSCYTRIGTRCYVHITDGGVV